MVSILVEFVELKSRFATYFGGKPTGFINALDVESKENQE